MTPEILARITLARAERDLSDLARAAVGTAAAAASPTERIRAARRSRQLVNEIVDLTVLAAALAGTPWEEIARSLSRRDPGTVEAEYADAVAEWKAMSQEDLVAAAAGAEDLDAWYVRHREDYDPDEESPVTDLLNLG
ncbi:hypothetical protein [Streptomyces anulatus]|uniref:hypothetical protein n=1 Tax=Streptomyces anulatus TaxID=1892 RepID=UPI0037DC10BC|nr:hypothetical protein OHB50_39060 [Streptomyces anulatus]